MVRVWMAGLLVLGVAGVVRSEDGAGVMEGVMGGLVSGSFEGREGAQRQIELMMAEEYRALAGRREVLEKLKGEEGVGVADAGAMAALLDARVAFSRFVVAVTAMPGEKQGALLAWGGTAEGCALVSRAYGLRVAQRVAAAKELAKNDSEGAKWVLTQMINDDEREVELGAMDAVWDKKPTPELVEAVWNRATYTQAMMQGRMAGQVSRTITVRGRQVQVYEQDYNAGYRQQDSDIACDLLIHFADPAVGVRLSGFLSELAGSTPEGSEYRFQQMVLGYSGQSWGFSRLIAAYKPRGAAPMLMRVALSPNIRDWSQINNGNKVYRYTSRVNAGALVLQIAGVDPGTFHLVDVGKNGRWAIEGAEAEENAFMEEMKKWWEAHGKEFDKPAG